MAVKHDEGDDVNDDEVMGEMRGGCEDEWVMYEQEVMGYECECET